MIYIKAFLVTILVIVFILGLSLLFAKFPILAMLSFGGGVFYLVFQLVKVILEQEEEFKLYEKKEKR